jgi:hypothetical protein
MASKLLLALVPAITIGIGSFTVPDGRPAVPLDRVELTAVEEATAQQPETQHFPPYLGYRFRTYRYGYSYASFPYRDPGFGYRHPGHRYSGYRYPGYHYTGFRYTTYWFNGYRYVSYRYAGYRYTSYRYGGYRYWAWPRDRTDDEDDN